MSRRVLVPDYLTKAAKLRDIIPRDVGLMECPRCWAKRGMPCTDERGAPRLPHMVYYPYSGSAKRPAPRLTYDDAMDAMLAAAARVAGRRKRGGR